MKIGVPAEIKDQEFRVGLTPAGVMSLVQSGHEVFVEQSAGRGCGYTDNDYQQAGGLRAGHGGQG
jgi:alanine dehydrogenase